MRTGWYQLPRSRQLFFGTIPPGAEEVGPSGAEVLADALTRPAAGGAKRAWQAYVRALATPYAAEVVDLEDQLLRLNKADLIAVADSLEQAAQGGEGGAPVWPEVPGLDLGPDPEQVTSAPGEGEAVDAQDGTP